MPVSCRVSSRQLPLHPQDVLSSKSSTNHARDRNPCTAPPACICYRLADHPDTRHSVSCSVQLSWELTYQQTTRLSSMAVVIWGFDWCSSLSSFALGQPALVLQRCYRLDTGTAVANRHDEPGHCKQGDRAHCCCARSLLRWRPLWMRMSLCTGRQIRAGFFCISHRHEDAPAILRTLHADREQSSYFAESEFAQIRRQIEWNNAHQMSYLGIFRHPTKHRALITIILPWCMLGSGVLVINSEQSAIISSFICCKLINCQIMGVPFILLWDTAGLTHSSSWPAVTAS